MLPSAKYSSRLFIIALISVFATSLVLGLSYTNDTGADLDFESEQQTVESIDNGLVSNITLSIEFLKTDGTCLEPLAGFAFHREIIFRLMSPSGTTVSLVEQNTYTGGVTVGTIIVIFDDTADVLVGGVPASGTFRPLEPLSIFNDEIAAGTWKLFMQDTIPLDPLCVFEWTLDIETITLNTAPIAEDFTVEILEDEVANFNFLDYVSDDDGDPLTIEILNDPASGTLELADDSSATFMPEEEWAGVVTVDYLANDGELDSEPATVTIIVLPVNDTPNCDAANLSEDVLWPPNHKEVTLDISGITDIDSTIITTEFTEITSNEPVNGIGDGNTDPDWSLDEAWVRAERSGNGNDRVYSISFSADDDDWTGTFEDPDNLIDPDPEPIDEGACESTGEIIVPHDRGSNNLNIVSNNGSDTAKDNNNLGSSNDGSGASTLANTDIENTTNLSASVSEPEASDDGNAGTTSETINNIEDELGDINGCNGNGNCYGHGNGNGNSNGNSNGTGRRN